MWKCQQKSEWLFVDVLNLLCWPSLASLLAVQPGHHYLDIACGNGLTSRRLAALGAQVTAFDFSAKLIEKAIARSSSSKPSIAYHVKVPQSLIFTLCCDGWSLRTWIKRKSR